MMTTRFLLLRCLLMLICCSTCERETKGATNENAIVTAWQPNPYVVSETNTFWGAETNYVKVGLNIQYSPDPIGRTLVGFVVVLYYNSDSKGNFTPILKTTNGNVRANRFSLILPPTSSRYKMALFDDNGNVVAKTRVGKSFDLPFDTNPKTVDKYHGYVNAVLFPFQLDVLPSDKIVLENYFDITKAGKYHLKFVLNTLQGADDRGAQPFPLPVDADVEIKRP